MAMLEVTPSFVIELNAEDGTLELDALVANPARPALPGVKIRGLIDTGSFMTFVPSELVSRLGLEEQGEIHVRGIRFDNPGEARRGEEREEPRDHLRPIYPITVSLIAGGTTFPPRGVIAASAKQSKLIVGRNLLQWFTFHYYGPGALNPHMSDGAHDPMARPSFFELGDGLPQRPRIRL